MKQLEDAKKINDELRTSQQEAASAKKINGCLIVTGSLFYFDELCMT
ncbi:hypothetical protein [Bacillus stratosphericus]|nr:hypothetical protein [Bacillus stratosphericus]